MKNLTIELQREWQQINRFRTLSLLSIVILLMLTPLFLHGAQQLQEIRQRAQSPQNAVIAQVDGQQWVSTDSGSISDSSASAEEIPAYTEPYYPEVSPWLFIIPGIIILLAILFH